MAIKMVVGGIEVTISNPAEAAALLRELQGTSAQKSLPLRTTHGGQGPDSSPPEQAKLSYRFLDAIRSAGEPGATSEGIAQALGVKEKGIGSKLSIVKQQLGSIGFQDGEVFSRIRFPRDGMAYWQRGPRFDEAYEALRKTVVGG